MGALVPGDRKQPRRSAYEEILKGEFNGKDVIYVDVKRWEKETALLHRKNAQRVNRRAAPMRGYSKLFFPSLPAAAEET